MDNKLYIFADGDEIGALVGAYVLKDDANAFIRQSRLIREGNRLIADWISSVNGEVYNNEGDEIVGHIDPNHAEELERIRDKYHEITGHSISIGLGNTLSEAGKALIAAKITGKNKIVMYHPEVEDILNEAHMASMEGTASEEQKKMDEQYIHAIKDDHENAHEDGMPKNDEYDQHDKEEDDDDQFYEESPEDMMQYPEGLEEPFPEDRMVDQDIIPDGEIPLDLEEDELDMNDQYQDQYDQYQDQYDQYQDQYDQYQDQYDQYQDQYDRYQDQYDRHEKQSEGDEEASYEGETLIDLDENQEDRSSMDTKDHPEMDDQDSEPSEFEQEKPISLEGEEKILDEDKKDSDADKADPEMAADEDDIDADLMDVQTNEDILQRIAANLDAFKQNKELMEQIKEAKPELYASILGLLHNMIELARMISPDVAPSEQEQEIVDGPSGFDPEQREEEQRLPKQRG
jgi:hypothetical protein